MGRTYADIVSCGELAACDASLEGDRLGTRQLECFAAVAHEGGFTQAATLLGVSQTGVTKQVHLLERTVGTALVDRSTKPVTLIDTGRYILPLATQSLDALTEATRGMRAYVEGDAGPCRWGSCATATRDYWFRPSKRFSLRIRT
jgi:DNA-binding transcriptional LysR family regulator